MSTWGFTSRVEEQWRAWAAEHTQSPGLEPARVISQYPQEYRCAIPNVQTLAARVSGAYRNRQKRDGNFPVVGDWVGLEPLPGGEEGIIAGLLPRFGGVRRWAAGDETREQVIAANIDYLLLVFGLDGGRNFLSAMLERSLTAAWNSGAKPIIVLNKVDCASAELRAAAQAEAESLAFGLPVFMVSAKSLEGIEALAAAIEAEKTVAMLGKSGVGKSALVNAFFSAAQRSSSPMPPEAGRPAPALEGELGDNARGRHTTTNRQLYPIPGGAFIIDVPGLRELKIWSDASDLARSFPDVEELMTQCRFRNCSHGSEPGCALQAALEDGNLEERRYESYKKLQREIQHLERRQTQRAALEERKKQRQMRNRGRG